MLKKPSLWAILYGSIAVADIALMLLDAPEGRYITKPLLMPVLLIFYLCIIGLSSLFAKLVTGALFCSWLGDVFLLFDGFFIPGLISFLLAHLLYITYTLKVKGRGLLQVRPWLAIPVLLYLVLMTVVLNPFLEDLKIPVFVYSVVICLFLAMAMNLFGKTDRKTALLFFAGASQFVLSDSLLAVNQFVYPFPLLGEMVMLSYCTAQYLIVSASARHITQANS